VGGDDEIKPPSDSPIDTKNFPPYSPFTNKPTEPPKFNDNRVISSILVEDPDEEVKERPLEELPDLTFPYVEDKEKLIEHCKEYAKKKAEKWERPMEIESPTRSRRGEPEEEEKKEEDLQIGVYEPQGFLGDAFLQNEFEEGTKEETKAEATRDEEDGALSEEDKEFLELFPELSEHRYIKNFLSFLMEMKRVTLHPLNQPDSQRTNLTD